MALLIIDVCHFLKFLLLALESLDLAVEYLLKLSPFAPKLFLFIKVLDRIRAWPWSSVVNIFILRALVNYFCGYLSLHYCLLALLCKLCFNFRRFLHT